MKSFGLSDTGRSRKRNEDAFFLDEARGIFAVADGLGGLPEGHLASRAAVAALEHAVTAHAGPPADLEAFVHDAHREIVELGRRIGPGMSTGTTLTILVAGDTGGEIAHIGDSALFRFTPDRFEKLTTDHTVAEYRRSRGEAVADPREEHILTRCLGQPEALHVDLLRCTLSPGDRLLLCTDGVTLAIPPSEIHKRMQEADSPETAVCELIDLANQRGGRDNATAIAVFI